MRREKLGFQRIIKDIIKVLKTKLKSLIRRQDIYKYVSFTKKYNLPLPTSLFSILFLRIHMLSLLGSSFQYHYLQHCHRFHSYAVFLLP